MNRIQLKHLLAAMIAVFALSAVVVASASATLPEFRQGGKPLSKVVKFTSTSGESTLKSSAGSIVCKEDTNKGEALKEVAGDSKHINVTVTFKKCKQAILGECKSGTTKETIVTKPLFGWLYYIKEPPSPEVGLWLKAKTGNQFATFTCGTTAVEVKSVEKVESGSCVAGKVSPINKEEEKGELVFNELAGKQEFREVKYEGKTITCELESKIGAGSFEPAQEISTDKITWSPAGTKVEVKG